MRILHEFWERQKRVLQKCRSGSNVRKIAEFLASSALFRAHIEFCIVLEHLPSSHVILSHHRDYLRVEATVADIENAFPGLQLHQFVLPSLQKVGNLIIRSLNLISIPKSIEEDVETIFGLSDFPFVHARARTEADFPGINITPDILLPYYNISSEGSPKSQKSLQAVAEFQQEYFYPYAFPDVRVTICRHKLILSIVDLIS